MEQGTSITKYKLIFISNYINHHQIPFCNAMYELLGEGFLFIQTEPMEEERVKMGWQEIESLPYLKLFYEEPKLCRELIMECEAALFGGTDEESYIVPRLEAGKPVIRYSERIYKTGQWKAISPRGLVKKYKDHTRYRKAPVYLLCSGAYVPSDFHIVRAYTNKMFCWGYFPETKHYDVDKLLDSKGWMADPADEMQKVPYLLWAARFIDWKHPDLPLRTAYYLKILGRKFHMDIVGGGELEASVKALWEELELQDCVTFVGYQTPAQVRERMEKADIFLQTSDREEGWGAVANEAMNSGCALVSNHMIGAVPYLVRHGENGFVYKDGDNMMLYRTVGKLVRDPELRRTIGRNAYKTITEVWNAEYAAKHLLELIDTVVLGESKDNKRGEVQRQSGGAPGNAEEQYRAEMEMDFLAPCMPAPVIPERKMWEKLTGQK